MPVKNKLALTVQYAGGGLRDALPRPLLRRWVSAALLASAEFTLRFVDADEGRTLNRTYRGKDYATNVLTFAYGDDGDNSDEGVAHAAPDGTCVETAPLRADIILCGPVLQREAVEQNKSILAHTAHLVVHGVLHAQGYDHETESDATEMEALEVEILGTLGFANPYGAENGS